MRIAAVAIPLALASVGIRSHVHSGPTGRVPARSRLAHTYFHRRFRQPAVPAPVQVDADALNPIAAPGDALLAARDQTISVFHDSPLGVTQPQASSEPRWITWSYLRSTAIPVHAAQSDIVVYGARFSLGATLSMVNTSQEKRDVTVRFRLPRGVYKAETLTYSPERPGSPATDTAPAVPVTPAGVHLRTLEGADFSSAHTLVKPLTLLPGEVCVLRCTDEAEATWSAMQETRQRLHEMAADAPGPSRRMRRMLDEAEGYLSGLKGTPGRHSSVEQRLGCIHRLLLSTAQAQSLHRNLQARHSVPAEKGGLVMGAMERLSDSLAETSAALLGLVPAISVTLPVQESTPAAGNTTTAPVEGPQVSVTLANRGSRAVGAVKVGLDPGLLPEGARPEPEDPALFGALRPGQTARAAFHVRGTASASVPASSCVGDVSYFIAGAAAHLRARAW